MPFVSLSDVSWKNFLAPFSLPHGPDSIFDWPLVDTATDAPPGHAPPPWRPPRQLTNASVFFHRGIRRLSRGPLCLLVATLLDRWRWASSWCGSRFFNLPNPLAGGALAGVGRKTLTMAGKHLPRAVSPRTLLRLIVTEDGRARTPVGATVEFLSRDFLCVCTRRGRLCFFFGATT